MNFDFSDQDRRMLNQSVFGWRTANVEIDTAIQTENWCAIEPAQINRSAHANMIALIVNKYSDPLEQGARP